MNEPGSPGGGKTRGTPRALVWAPAALAAVLAAILVMAIGVVVALSRQGVDHAAAAGTDAATSASEIFTASPRMSRLEPLLSAPEATGLLEVSGPVCDAPVINSDLHYSDGVARIIDCSSGWAVMASGVSGDLYWVSYWDGRWRRAGGVSSELGTCPGQAIARGVPAWMAQKHLSCPPRDPKSPVTTTPRTSPVTTSPATSPEPTTSPARTTSPVRTVSPARTSSLARAPHLTPRPRPTPRPTPTHTSPATTSAQPSDTSPTSSPTSPPTYPPPLFPDSDILVTTPPGVGGIGQ